MLPKAPTAASGVRKVGICALRRILRAGTTVASPIQQLSSGLGASRLASARAWATPSASAPGLGEKMANTPSICRSENAACSARA